MHNSISTTNNTLNSDHTQTTIQSEDDQAVLEDIEEESWVKDLFTPLALYFGNPYVLEVALIMAGVGSDNLAIYMVRVRAYTCFFLLLIMFC